MRSLALVLCACTGCDVLFGIHGVAVGSDAHGGSDAQPTDAGTNQGACSPMTMLADDFSTDDLAVVWPQSSALASNQLLVSGGRAVLENLSQNSYITLDPGRYYDLRDTYFSAQITDDLAMDASDYVLLELDAQTGYGVTIMRDNTTLKINELSPHQPPVLLGSFPYSAGSHAYLRAGVIGGTLVVETSPDGSAWVPAAALPDASGFTFVRPWIQTHRGMLSPQFTVYVDNVDGGTPSGTACPIALLRDDFSENMLRDVWARSPHYNGTVTVANGVADVVTTGTNSAAGLFASTVYDLENAAIFVEIPVMLASSTANAVTLVVTTGTGDTLSISQSNGYVTTAAQHNGGQMANVMPYDPVAMRWWQLQNSAGKSGWAFSPDGVTWTALAQTIGLSGIDRCDLGLVVSANSGGSGDTQFDNVNVHP